MVKKQRIFEVKKFMYDGLFIHGMEGYADYKAEPIRWTKDPGMLVCHCSDNKERLIPACQLEGLKADMLPAQKDTPGYKTATEAGVMAIMGTPCSS